MRVSVYKGIDGPMTALVVASPGKGRPPVLLSNITEENVVRSVLPVIEGMRLPKGEQLSLPQ